MNNQPPSHIPINHDDFHAEFVGHTSDNRQFFLTNPFISKSDKNHGRTFLALYIFDDAGNLLEAKIEDLGTRQTPKLAPGNKLDIRANGWIMRRWLNNLGNCSFGNIRIKPFRLKRFEVEFGLIPQTPEENGGNWSVNVEPGVYMKFYSPWNGEYFTQTDKKL